jgi:hypothetical protein
MTLDRQDASFLDAIRRTQIDLDSVPLQDLDDLADHEIFPQEARPLRRQLGDPIRRDRAIAIETPWPRIARLIAVDDRITELLHPLRRDQVTTALPSE